jgi:hypothetical protein
MVCMETWGRNIQKISCHEGNSQLGSTACLGERLELIELEAQITCRSVINEYMLLHQMSNCNGKYTLLFQISKVQLKILVASNLNGKY